MNLEKLIHEVCSVSGETAVYIAEQRKALKTDDVEVKGFHDFVTHVDKTAERKIVERLQKILPEAGFITEENTINKLEAVYNWIIDPLDGTTNFIHGEPCYSISIGLSRGDTIIAGVVLEINQNEMFYAWENSPAFCNENIISVSKTPKLESSLLATGFPYQDYSLTKAYLELFQQLMLKTRGLRRLGSAAVDLAYVACGRFDAFYEYGLNPWDVAGGSIIVKQAGGFCSDFNGSNNFIHGKRLIASNQLIHSELQGIIRQYFKQ